MNNFLNMEVQDMFILHKMFGLLYSDGLFYKKSWI